MRLDLVLLKNVDGKQHQQRWGRDANVVVKNISNSSRAWALVTFLLPFSSPHPPHHMLTCCHLDTLIFYINGAGYYLALCPVGLGAAGSLVSVKRGYGRNYLLPQGFAVYASEENVEKYGDGATLEEQAEEQAEDDAAALVRKVRQLCSMWE